MCVCVKVREEREERDQNWGGVVNVKLKCFSVGKVYLYFEIVFLTFLVLKWPFFYKTIIVGGS